MLYILQGANVQKLTPHECDLFSWFEKAPTQHPSESLAKTLMTCLGNPPEANCSNPSWKK